MLWHRVWSETHRTVAPDEQTNEPTGFDYRITAPWQWGSEDVKVSDVMPLAALAHQKWINPS